jgi:hypothetical protein
MTLLITKIENEKIMVLADTQLTFDEKKGKRPVDGLKIFFINSSTAIGYSGSPTKAHEIIKHLYKNHSADNFNSIAQRLKKFLKGEESPDFILMKAGPNPKIIKIFDGKTTEDTLQLAWIGNSQAANDVIKSSNDSFVEISQNVKAIIYHRKFRDIGGLITYAIGQNSGFKFMPHMSLTSPYYRPPNGKKWGDRDALK